MIRIAAVGDLMLGDSAITVGFGVRSRYGGMRLAEVFRELSPRLSAADVAIGNLECVLSQGGEGRSRWARDQMRGDRAYARVLREAGFSAIGVANNHALQHGEAAFWETVSALREEGLLVIGLRGTEPWHTDPVTYTHSSGATAAILGYSWRPRQYGHGRPPYAEVNPASVLADVARARALTDSVVVSLHWGEEFVDQPSAEEVSLARALAEGGADLVLGHHPHVVRPFELHGDSVIGYSLGNCATDMLWQPALRRGALIEAALSPRPTDVRVCSIAVADDYRISVAREGVGVAPGSVLPLDADAYREVSGRAILAQRAAAYRYAASNANRYPPSVLASLFAATLRNKSLTAIRRLKGNVA